MAVPEFTWHSVAGIGFYAVLFYTVKWSLDQDLATRRYLFSSFMAFNAGLSAAFVFEIYGTVAGTVIFLLLLMTAFDMLLLAGQADNSTDDSVAPSPE